MDGAASAPQTRLGASSVSIVSSATATFSGCAAAPTATPARPDRPRRATPIAPAPLPRARVTRRYSTETIDGGSGD